MYEKVLCVFWKIREFNRGFMFIDGLCFNLCIFICLDWNLRLWVEWVVCFFLNNLGIEECYEYSLV